MIGKAEGANRTWVAFLLPAVTFLTGCEKKNQDQFDSHQALVQNSVAVLQSPTQTILSEQATVRLLFRQFDDSLEVPVRIETDVRRSRQLVAPAAGRITSVSFRSTDILVQPGDTIATLYAPEIITAQREYLLVLKSGDNDLLSSAIARLIRIGLTPKQIQTLKHSGKIIDPWPVISPVSGFLTSLASQSAMATSTTQVGNSSGMSGMGASSLSNSGMASDNSEPGSTNGSQSDANFGSTLRVGTYVEKGTPLIEINDLKIVCANLSLPLSRLGLLREGDSVHVMLPNLGYANMARLDFLEARIADSNRNLQGKVYLSNPDGILKLGQLGMAHLSVKPEHAWVLPLSAVHNLGDREIVWARVKPDSNTLDSTAFQAREVRVGRRGRQWVEIVEGLDQGEAVARNASVLLDPDAVVAPIPIHPDAGMASMQKSDHSNHTQAANNTEQVSHPSNHLQASLILSAEEEHLAGIRIAKVEIRHLQTTAIFRGTTQFDASANEQVTLKVTGTIEKVDVIRLGEKVHFGQRLASIASDEMLAAQQEHLLALTQIGALTNQKTVQNQIQAAKRRLLLLGLSSQSIDHLEKIGQPAAVFSVLCPRDGLLLQINAKPGQYATLGTSLFTIGSSKAIWVETWMLPEELETFPMGTEAWVRLEGESNLLKGQLEHSQNSTSISGSQGTAHITLKTTPTFLFAGLQAWVTLKKEKLTAIAVPPSALLPSREMSTIWLRTGAHTYTSRMVKTGLHTPEAVEIVNGLEVGEDVVVAGAYLLNGEWMIRNGSSSVHAQHGK